MSDLALYVPQTTDLDAFQGKTLQNVTVTDLDAADPVEAKLIAAIAFATQLPEKPRRELVGKWLWLDFADKPEKETREAMKAHGFKWHVKQGRWYYPAVAAGRRSGWNMNQIRAHHGSFSLD